MTIRAYDHRFFFNGKVIEANWTLNFVHSEVKLYLLEEKEKHQSVSLNSTCIFAIKENANALIAYHLTIYNVMKM